jgi:hypothetical protein
MGSGRQGDRFNFNEHYGALLLFVDPVFEQDVDTNFGVANRIVSRYLVVLDGEHGGDVYTDAHLYGKQTVYHVKGGIDVGLNLVLGRASQATSSQQGQNPANLLEDATPEDEAMARQWLQSAQGGGYAKVDPITNRITLGGVLSEADKGEERPF